MTEHCPNHKSYNIMIAAMGIILTVIFVGSFVGGGRAETWFNSGTGSGPETHEIRHPPITTENVTDVRLLRTWQLPEFSAGNVSQCSVDFSPDGNMLTGVCYKSTAPVWDVQSGQLLYTLKETASHDVAVSFSPDGEMIAIGGFENEIRLYHAATGESLGTLDPLPSPIWDLDFGPDGEKLASANFYYHPSDVPGMHLWQIPNRELLWTYGKNEYLSVDYDPSGDKIAYGALSGGAVIVEPEMGQLIVDLPIPSHVGDLAFSPDSRLLATGSDDHKIRLWRTADGHLLDTWKGHAHYVNGVAFSPDGRWLVSGSHDRKVGIWDVQRGVLLQWLEGHEDAVLRVAIHPSGTLIASISWDGTVRLWGLVHSR